jgi:hypothetical protein
VAAESEVLLKALWIRRNDLLIRLVGLIGRCRVSEPSGLIERRPFTSTGVTTDSQLHRLDRRDSTDESVTPGPTTTARPSRSSPTPSRTRPPTKAGPTKRPPRTDATADCRLPRTLQPRARPRSETRSTIPTRTTMSPFGQENDPGADQALSEDGPGAVADPAYADPSASLSPGDQRVVGRNRNLLCDSRPLDHRGTLDCSVPSTLPETVCRRRCAGHGLRGHEPGWQGRQVDVRPERQRYCEHAALDTDEDGRPDVDPSLLLSSRGSTAREALLNRALDFPHGSRAPSDHNHEWRAVKRRVIGSD